MAGVGFALAALTALADVAAASRRPAYCSIPAVNSPPWGFHAGQPITGAQTMTISYFGDGMTYTRMIDEPGTYTVNDSSPRPA